MKRSLTHPICGRPGCFRWPKGVALALVLGGQLAGSMLPGVAAAAPPANRANAPDESSFKIISERNIFNSRRSARYVPSSSTRRASRFENFALVGTLSYDKGPFAFFEGSRSDYRKVLKAEDTIAGFKIVAVEPTFVKLASPTNEIELRVGMQLRREDEGEWRLLEQPENLEVTSSRSSYSRTTAAPAPSQRAGEPSLPAAEPPGPDAGFGPDGGPVVQMIDPQTGLPVPVSAPPSQDPGAVQPAGAASGTDDILARMAARKAAQERGEAP